MTTKVLAPIKITSAMVTASVVAEPDAAWGEVAWLATDSFSIGQERIRATTHRVYTSLATGIDAGLPESTPLRWKDTRPTNKFAAFDNYRSTKIRYAGTLTQTVNPGVITDMALFGLEGDALHMVVKNATSGTVYFDQIFSLSLYLSGDLEWSFWFDTPRQQDGLRIMGLYPQDAQVELSLTASLDTGLAGIGIWALGSFNDIGDPSFGFKAKWVDYSYIDIDAAGEAVIVKGLAAKDLAGTCVMPSAAATAVCDVVGLLLGVPCAWVVSPLVGYDYLSAFGLGSAEITAENEGEATAALNVKGLI
jgi:hypothetical protein